MKFCRNFADNLEYVEIILKFLNFQGEIPVLKEFEWFEWFEWFGPSPIEPFNSGADRVPLGALPLPGAELQSLPGGGAVALGIGPAHREPLPGPLLPGADRAAPLCGQHKDTSE